MYKDLYLTLYQTGNINMNKFKSLYCFKIMQIMYLELFLQLVSNFYSNASVYIYIQRYNTYGTRQLSNGSLHKLKATKASYHLKELSYIKLTII